MQGFHTYVGQALWDKDIVDTVGFAEAELGRMQAWAKHQVGVRAPQVLIVPVRLKKLQIRSSARGKT